MKYDVIVVGAGLAGMIAAISAQKNGASVLMIDKGAVGTGSNSAMSNGVFTAPTESFSIEEYIKETIEVGKGLNNDFMVRLVAKKAREAIKSLRLLGVDLEESNTSFTVMPSRQDVIRGVSMVRNIADFVKRCDRIKLLHRFYATDLLVEDHRIHGMKGFNSRGMGMTLFAPATVIATGGCGAIYLRNDNMRSIMGQGYALCARAGLDLWDMEFIQFYPLVIAEPGLPSVMLYPPYPGEAKLINNNGQDIAQKHGFIDLNDAKSRKRDAFSNFVYLEGRNGPVYMDYRSVPENKWDTYPLSLLSKIRFDFKHQPVRITPGAHYCIGGVRIHENGETSLPGLFACGEMVWGLHGANRRGGNALTECAVFGRMAGRGAADFSRKQNKSSFNPNTERISYGTHSKYGQLRSLRTQIREIAWNHAGVFRNRSGLEEGKAKLLEIEPELESILPMDTKEKRLKEDLRSAALVLKAILTASIERKESRGTFNREDFPSTDDIHWKKNSCLKYQCDTQKFDLSYHPVSDEQ